MAEPKAKDFDSNEKKHIMQGIQMLMQSTKRAETQMRSTNREAVADALRTELNAIAATAAKAERLL